MRFKLRLLTMPAVTQQKKVSQIASSKGEAIVELILEGAQFFFRVRAVGQKAGLFTSWGA